MPGAVESVRNVTFLGTCGFLGDGKNHKPDFPQKDFFQGVYPKKPVTHNKKETARATQE